MVDMAANRYVIAVRSAAVPSILSLVRSVWFCLQNIRRRRRRRRRQTPPSSLTTRAATPPHPAQVGEGEVADVKKGANAFRFHTPGMDVDGVKTSWLNNVGLLLAVLLNAKGEEVIQVSMVTQVMKGSDGKLERFVISPLE
jgi:hypothetical protein